MNIEQMDVCDELEAKWATVHGGAFSVMRRAKREIERLRADAALVRAQALEEAAQEASQMLTTGRSPLGNLVAKAIRALKESPDSKPLGGEG